MCTLRLLEMCSLFLSRNSYEHSIPGLLGLENLPLPFTLLFNLTIQGLEMPNRSLTVHAWCTIYREAAFLRDLTLWEYGSQMQCESLLFQKSPNTWDKLAHPFPSITHLLPSCLSLTPPQLNFLVYWAWISQIRQDTDWLRGAWKLQFWTPTTKVFHDPFKTPDLETSGFVPCKRGEWGWSGRIYTFIHQNISWEKVGLKYSASCA